MRTYCSITDYSTTTYDSKTLLIANKNKTHERYMLYSNTNQFFECDDKGRVYLITSTHSWQGYYIKLKDNYEFFWDEPCLYS